MEGGPLVVNVIVPGDRIGWVIGKAGSGLKAAREQSGGCKLEVDKNADNGAPTRRVTLSGDVNQIAAAFSIVAQKAYADDSHGLPTVLIPASIAGAVVGKGGENLKAARQASGVSVKVEREPVIDHTTGNQERLVTFDGDRSGYGVAIQVALGGARAAAVSASAPIGAYTRHGIVNGSSGGNMPRTAMTQTTQSAPNARGEAFASQLSNVRTASEDPEQLQLHMYVPHKLVGAIVGKEGATIKNTGAISGCNCSVTNRDAGDRRVVIMGTFHQCTTAQNMLFDQLRAAAKEANDEPISEVKVIFFIRKEAVGAVIGKQGSQLASIREQSQCNIQVDRSEVMGQRACTMTGGLQAVVLAQKFVADLVQAVPVDVANTGKRPLHDVQTAGRISMEGLPPKRGRTEATPELGFHTNGGRNGSGPARILIANRLAGAVIGKAGANLKSLREGCSADIKVQKAEEAPQWPQDRVVTVAGSVSSKAEALIAVLDSAFVNDPATMELKMLVPSSAAGAVIGRQGANLKDIRERAGIKAEVDRNEMQGERLLQATGSRSQVSVVIQRVLELMDGIDADIGQAPPSAAPLETAYGGPVDYTSYFSAGAAAAHGGHGY